jgi:hypothetical protein
MKADTISALELLRSQHQEVDDLIEQIENSDESDEKSELFRELADKIAAHATIEEKLFYPSAMADQTRELLVEATEEHLSVKRLLADMLDLEVDDEHFDGKLTVLKEQFRHHAHDAEESELFPLVETVLSEDELLALGNELLVMYEELIEQEPRKQVPAQTMEAAPLI